MEFLYRTRHGKEKWYEKDDKLQFEDEYLNGKWHEKEIKNKNKLNYFRTYNLII